MQATQYTDQVDQYEKLYPELYLGEESITDFSNVDWDNE